MSKDKAPNLLQQVDQLLADDATPAKEVAILQSAKADLTKHVYEPRVAADLQRQLSPLAARGQLSSAGVHFLSWLAASYHGWGQRGMGMTEL
ncbi:bacteriocin immunity protein [Lacticaseibacillus camelliae]|nr:bacteriocin immunity protein [Lacticaseibacillus camelliae]